MISGISLGLFDIHANPASGYGFSVLTVGYSVTNGMTSGRDIGCFGFNFSTHKICSDAYDKYIWISFLFMSIRINLKRVRPIRPDGTDYWDWYKDSCKRLAALSDKEYYESYAIKHYLENFTPHEAAQEFFDEF